MFAHKAGAQHGEATMGDDTSNLIYDTDTIAVTAAQQAINKAGYTPALTVTGVYDAATQAGAAWLWTNGSSTPFSGHIDSAFLDAVGIDPVKGGYAGTAAFSVTKAAPAPAAQSASETKTVLGVAAVGATFGFAFGGPLGAAIGAAVGAIGGAVLHARSGA